MMHHTKTKNLGLGDGLEDHDGGDRVVVVEERELGAKGGETRGGRLHEARS